MGKLSHLEPKAIWEIFEQICNIPHPSKNEARIVNFVKQFGENLGLETIVDDVGNVIIRKPATSGYENRKGIILQGHLDMVPQKNSDKNHNFETDPIEPIIVENKVKANGTTLGADNGIGVAAALAVLQAKDINHGPIEALFTVDEETGMTGAFNLKPGLLKGEILINLDSEDEGEIYVGCAGGLDANIVYNYQKEKSNDQHVAFKISLIGLKGGHSGMDINSGRANANKLMNRFLKYATRKFHIRLSFIDGGSLRNAIPRESFVIVTLPSELEHDFTAAIKEFEKIFKSEYGLVEPDLKFFAEKVTKPEWVIDRVTQENLIHAIYGCPNGVIRMSDAMPGLVETSNNLASIKMNDQTIQVNCLLRSSVDSAKKDLSEAIHSVFVLSGAKVEFSGGYPGWKPNMNSPILQVAQQVYKQKFGKTPEIKAIHAGLECGLFAGVYPNLDMISFGPTIRYPHSPDEEVHIATVQKFWDFLVEVLKNAPLNN
ncbi:MAG: aminoacyl-histidine dipeptidase [Bacteroidales bacterium]|nr:aminoacyl-histidine dipeptidase [Bacteroidales bacterium]